MRTPVIRLVVLCCLVTFGALAWPTPSVAMPLSVKQVAILKHAKGLIDKGMAEDAYALLAPMEDRLAGQKDYDYLLGLSLLDSGRAELATIPLERVLTVDPKFAGARMALARAYAAMGDFASAKSEFLKVLQYNPPPQVRIVVHRYLTEMKKRETASRTHVHGYLSTRIGHDSNVNNGPGVATFAVPALNNIKVTLASTNQRTSSIYGELAAGASLEHQFSKGFGLYAGLDANHRDLPRAHNFDQSGISGNFGTILGSGANKVRIGGLAGQSYLSGSNYYRTFGANTSWQHAPDKHNLWTLFGQANTIRYNDATMISYDINQFLLGLSTVHAMGRHGKTILAGSLYGGHEHDTHHRADGAKNLWGANLGTQTKLIERLSLYGSLGMQMGHYKSQNAAFLVTRRDKLYSATIGLAWLLAKHLTLKTEVDYSKNISNIVLYGYRRNDVSMTLRRDFD